MIWNVRLDESANASANPIMMDARFEKTGVALTPRGPMPVERAAGVLQ